VHLSPQPARRQTSHKRDLEDFQDENDAHDGQDDKDDRARHQSPGGACLSLDLLQWNTGDSLERAPNAAAKPRGDIAARVSATPTFPGTDALTPKTLTVRNITALH